MSSQQDPAGDREVFRSTGSLILWWLWAVFAAVTLVDLIVQGSGHSAVIMAVLVVAITALVYGCAFRPRIVADAGGITVENPLRDHRVPWGAVEKVDAVHAVRVHCVAAPGASKGKIINSWAVQSSPRAARAAEYRSRRQARRLGQRARLWPLPGRGPGGPAPQPGRGHRAPAGRAGEPGARGGRRGRAAGSALGVGGHRGDGRAAAGAHRGRARLSPPVPGLGHGQPVEAQGRARISAT